MLCTMSLEPIGKQRSVLLRCKMRTYKSEITLVLLCSPPSRWHVYIIYVNVKHVMRTNPSQMGRLGPETPQAAKSNSQSFTDM